VATAASVAVAVRSVIIDAVSPDLPGIAIVVDDVDTPCSSAIDTIGGYVVVLTTSVTPLAVTVTSTYIGAINGDTAVTHLRLAPRRAAQLHQHILSGPQAGETHARSCLLDHTAELQQLLVELTNDAVKILIGPAALECAARAWQQQPS